jgi:hypothetical protein
MPVSELGAESGSLLGSDKPFPRDIAPFGFMICFQIVTFNHHRSPFQSDAAQSQSLTSIVTVLSFEHHRCLNVGQFVFVIRQSGAFTVKALGLSLIVKVRLSVAVVLNVDNYAALAVDFAGAVIVSNCLRYQW